MCLCVPYFLNKLVKLLKITQSKYVFTLYGRDQLHWISIHDFATPWILHTWSNDPLDFQKNGYPSDFPKKY